MILMINKVSSICMENAERMYKMYNTNINEQSKCRDCRFSEKGKFYPECTKLEKCIHLDNPMCEYGELKEECHG